MILTVNNKTTEAEEGCNVEELASQLALPAQGVAIAVNNKMIPRPQWAGCVLKENDSVVIIKAAYGG